MAWLMRAALALDGRLQARQRRSSPRAGVSSSRLAAGVLGV